MWANAALVACRGHIRRATQSLFHASQKTFPNLVSVGHERLVQLNTFHSSLVAPFAPSARRWNSGTSSEVEEQQLPPNTGPDGRSYMEIEKDIAAMHRSIRDLHGNGDYKESLEVSKQALELSRSHFGDEHPVSASLLNNIALNEKCLGHLDEALASYGEALRIYESVVGETHTSCATCKLNIAKLLQLQANNIPGLDRVQLLQQAKELGEEALVIKLDNLGENNPEVGTVMFSLGAIYNDLKMHDEAVETLQEVGRLIPVCLFLGPQSSS